MRVNFGLCPHCQQEINGNVIKVWVSDSGKMLFHVKGGHHVRCDRTEVKSILCNNTAKHNMLKKHEGRYAVVFRPDGTVLTRGKLMDMSCLIADGVDVKPWMIGNYDFREDEITYIEETVRVYLAPSGGGK